MDETRRDLAYQVSENLMSQNLAHAFFDDLLVFDNSSKYRDHLKVFSPPVKVVRSDENIGYWSAIHWTLSNYQRVFNRKYKYLYVIESDLEHWDMFKLDSCERFLNDHLKVGGVRTQEFSVKFRMLYDKRYHWVPFVKRHSLVSQKNVVTKERVWFHRADNKNNVWTTNFHTKLPALNRLDALTTVFDRLAIKEQINEIYFMHLYYDLYPDMALLDGGIYRQISHRDTAHLSGSYSTAEELEGIGYYNTRTDYIRTQGFSVQDISHTA
jgi:hypothetical protein